MTRIGLHLLVDLSGVSAVSLDDRDLLSQSLEEAARRCRLTALAAPVMHRFAGGGVTGFILLAESHIALHSFPDRGYLALDIFCCGDGDPHPALDVFRERFKPTREHVTEISRG